MVISYNWKACEFKSLSRSKQIARGLTKTLLGCRTGTHGEFRYDCLVLAGEDQLAVDRVDADRAPFGDTSLEQFGGQGVL